MLIKLLRCFLGYVEFYAVGGFAERFINLCTVNGVKLWDVKNDGVKVYACTDFDGYKRIKNCARGSGMRVKIIKKHGAFYVLKRRKARVGLCFGAVAAVVLVALASGSIWSVQVEGVDAVKGKTLTEKLSEFGVKTGARKSKIDSEEIEKLLVEENPELLWASINIYGTRLVLEVRETTASPETEDLSVPINIVAAKRGRVKLIKGYRGTNRVKEGDFVEKGDILISGVITNRDLSETVVRASGSVICETEASFKGVCPFKSDVSITGEGEHYYKLSFFGITLPLYFKTDGEFTGSGEKMLSSKETELPIGILRESFCELQNTQSVLTAEEATLYAFTLAVEKKRDELSLCEINSVNYTVKQGETGVEVICEANCVEDIAKESEFYYDEPLNE